MAQEVFPHMEEKNPSVPSEKKPGEGKQWPETGKQGGHGDIGKKGGQPGGDLGKGADVGKKDQ